jgi:prolyl-tRNA editing enzyme YbaK/EbsC (Cys-tRNA(Pro) deacylase)
MADDKNPKGLVVLDLRNQFHKPLGFRCIYDANVVYFRPMFNSQILSGFILENEIQAEILHLEHETKTVTDAAAVLGVQPEQIIKSVLFLADGEPVIVISGGTARIAWKRLADYLNISRRRLKTGKEEQVLELTGYVVGSVPPFGHRQQLRTIVDTAVYSQSIVYGGGGDINALLKIDIEELRRVVGEETADLSDK